jgi:hypothetical protein
MDMSNSKAEVAPKLLDFRRMIRLGPPPLPAMDDPPEPNGFASFAAKACPASPFILLGFAALVFKLVPNQRDLASPLVTIVLSGVCVVIILTGFVLGVLSLFLARRGQRARVFGCSFFGLALLTLLVVAVAVPNFVRARNQALQKNQAFTDLHSALVDNQARTVASIYGTNSKPVNATQVQQAFARAAETSSGDTAALLRVGQRYIQSLQSFRHAFDRAKADVNNARVLDAKTLERREQLADRKAIIQKLINANDALKTFVLQSETIYRRELADSGVARAQQEAAMAQFHKRALVQHPVLLEIRAADDRMGKAALSVLNLFEAQWGKWRYDSTVGKLRFDDAAAVSQYNALMTEFRQAGTDEMEAQKRFAALSQQYMSSL